MTAFAVGTRHSRYSTYSIFQPCRVENGVTCGWAPDGRHFVTATTAPRLRVDNAFYVYKYNGLLLHKKEFSMLSGADWVPAPAGESNVCLVR